MGYEFEWDPEKATTNLRVHSVSLEEASTVFADPLAMLMADPDHSVDEERYVLLGLSTERNLLDGRLRRAATAHSTDQRETGDAS